MPQILQSTRVRASQKAAFNAFTTATGLREWLCARAFTQPHAKGRYWMRWDDGARVEGQYLHVTAAESLSFTWRSADLPGQTTVRVLLEASDGQIEVKIAHVGFGAGSGWHECMADCRQTWEDGLANLRSVLESGIDLRHAQRPYLGIRWGLADHCGIRVLEVIGGNGADADGLEPGDAIRSIGANEVSGYRTMVDALESCVAGETVDVLVARNDHEVTIPVVLGAVARSEKLLGPRNIVAGVRDHQIRIQRFLSDTLAGTTEEDASQRATPDGWSVKETLAHLSTAERNLHHRLFQIIMRSWDDTPAGNPAMLPEALAAAMSRTDTLPRLLDRFAQDQAETLAIFQSLRPEVFADRARYRRLAEAVDTSEHTRQHIEQIATTLSAIRQHRSERMAAKQATQQASGASGE